MYRGLELKDNSRVIDCNFVTEYKDEEGIKQKIAICILCHTPKMQEFHQVEFNGLKANGTIEFNGLSNDKPNSYLEYKLI